VSEPANVKKAGDPGIPSAVGEGARNHSDNVVFGGDGRHGFAAEKASHLYDVLCGKHSRPVGGDKRLDGPDRIVNGLAIQSRYCQSGSRCIQACFRDGVFPHM